MQAKEITTTEDERAFSRPVNMLRNLTDAVGLKNACCRFEEVSMRFAAYFREKTFSVAYTDLENQLFLLSKERFIHMSVISANLNAFTVLHPLLVLAVRNNAPKSVEALEKEFERVIASTPGLVPQYKWTMRAIQFLNDVAVKWGLITVHDFVPRFNLIPGTVVVPTQLSECSLLEETCFVPDVLYFATSPAKAASNQTKITCLRVKAMLMQLMEVLLVLNKDIDFSKNHEVTDFLFRGGRSTADLTANSSRISPIEKREFATRHNLHLLELPPWWKCECLFSEEDRMNMLLRTYLKFFCKVYCELEAMIALPTV